MANALNSNYQEFNAGTLITALNAGHTITVEDERGHHNLTKSPNAGQVDVDGKPNGVGVVFSQFGQRGMFGWTLWGYKD